ncbi:asparaginyl-tRNA synthetase [Babesia ovis]|uniref:Asparaginyl-tRNA synthetase n=1 Tax=Babesia ovis TaxID=5869 RepID=A0A9W5TE17_BABOV|nr:asparaginyl-tRNA synthetase [Babesia ovis]
MDLGNGDIQPTPQLALWLPPSWHRLKPHLENFKDAKNLEIDIFTDNERDIIDGELYNLMCREGNICMLSTNFVYKTHLSRALDTTALESMLQFEDSQGNSVGDSVNSRVGEECLIDLSDDESEFLPATSNPAIFFLIFTKEDIVNVSVNVLKQRITTAVEVLKVLYSDVKVLLVMHAMRLYALHGNNITGDTQTSSQEAQPLIHSLCLDEIICSLMVEYQVDTVEAEDDVDLARFMVNACSSTELCITTKRNVAFKSKPHCATSEEIPIAIKTWITQLQQIPEVGKEAAIAIATIYSTPGEILEAVEKSPEDFINSLRNINIGNRGARKLGKSAAKSIKDNTANIQSAPGSPGGISPNHSNEHSNTNAQRCYRLVAWVKKIIENREKTATYLELVDGTTSMHVPVVIRDSHKSYSNLLNIDVGDAVTIVATPEFRQSDDPDRHASTRLIVESDKKGHDFLVHQSHTNDRVESNPVALNGVYPMTHLREHCNLRAKNAIMQATFRIRSKVTEMLFPIMANMGFVHVTTPSLTNVNCEGMGEIFKAIAPNMDAEQQGDITYMSVSGQLELEALCSGISRVWKLGPAFRADRSDDIVEVIRSILVNSAEVILSHCQNDVNVLEKQGNNIIPRLEALVTTDAGIHKLSYTDAVGMLNDAKKRDQSWEHAELKWGDELTAAHERSLLKITERPLIAIMRYPAKIAPFYMERMADGTVNNVDIIAEGVGEIAGGSIREIRHDVLMQSMEEHNIVGNDYDRYLELRKYGNVPHGGFGIGFERMLMYLLGIQNIRDVIHFPKLRKKHNIE